MADNKQLPPTGTGTADIVVATDEIGGVDYQKVKLVDGTADSTTAAKVSAEGNLQTITPNRTASGTLDALNEAVTISCDGMASLTIQTTDTALSGSLVLEGSLDGSDWRYFSAGQQDGVTGPTNVIGPSDEVYQADCSIFAQARVRCSAYTSGSVLVSLLATAAPALTTVYQPVHLLDADGDEAQVIGGALSVRLAANSGIDIGDVDVASIAAGDNNIGNVDIVSVPAPLSTTGNGTAATAHRVTLASDSTGQVAVASIAAGDNNIGNVDVVSLPALVAGTANIGDVDVLTVPSPLSTAGNGTAATAHRVTIASDSTGQVAVASLPALVAGSANIGDVDVLTMPNVTLAAGTNTNEVVGDVAQDQPIAGNPVSSGWRASTAVPTAMSGDGDVVYPWANRSGAPVVTAAPHVGLNSDPWNLVHEGAQYTAAQTSTVLVAGGASEKIVVTQMQIQAFSTTAGTVVVYFGTGAFARGTNRTIFDGEFAPSATLKPGAILTGPFISGANGDDILVTTVGDIDITISCWYYVIT